MIGKKKEQQLTTLTVCNHAPVKVQLPFMSVQPYIIYVVANREFSHIVQQQPQANHQQIH